MASSNKHWPSMFKSKPCNTHHQWQQQHDINPCSSVAAGCEERSPEPKPRWNPKPEQIRILEAIFNSGMVNPPRDEIRKIRAQLQEYGQVGDANVFYWFQNRKSRTKPKLRNPQQQSNKTSPENADKTTIIDVSDSPSGSVNQTYFHHQPQTEFLNEPFFFPGFTQGFAFPEQPVGPCVDNLGAVDPGSAAAAAAARSSLTVFVNDVAFEVAVGPFNVREAFGDDAILINSAGQPVLTNEWGTTLQSLQHGGFYYLLRSSTPLSE
ncbi:hypothetical protein HRI_003015500 [Hibiscus trionum]|uniref:Homeobox domain-containing protein n=1 Tax=Hibiscus trionum TaxID=183268 RepID=A0A9W7IC42_HIBTR|nr:hypothetical protein HRI_003015500 [Hibiscus trionum]